MQTGCISGIFSPGNGCPMIQGFWLLDEYSSMCQKDWSKKGSEGEGGFLTCCIKVKV